MFGTVVRMRTQRLLIGLLCISLGLFTYLLSTAVMKLPPQVAGIITAVVLFYYFGHLERVYPRTPVLGKRAAQYLSQTFVRAFALPAVMAAVFTAVYFSTGKTANAATAAVIAGAVLLFLTFPGQVTKLVGRMVRGRPRPLASSETKAAETDLPAGDPGITWGGLRIPSQAASSHFMALGTTGSGKTVTIRLLMQDVLRTIGAGPDHRALIYDAKQDIVSQLASMDLPCEIYTLNPFDTRCVAWDMARDITEPSAAFQAAVTLIPEDKGSSQPFFVNAAQTLLYGVILAFIIRKSDWRFSDLIHAMKGPERLRTILENVEETKHIPSMLFTDPETLGNIMATIATKVLPYEPVAALWEKAGERKSLEDWVSDRGTDNYILILGNSEKARAALDALNRVIFKRVSELILDQSEDRKGLRRNWIFLDELAEAGKLDGLTSLLAKGRSKGTCVVIGFQDIDALRNVYGKEEANALTGQCNNKAVLRLESPTTTEWATKFFGSYEAIEVKSSETKVHRTWFTTQQQANDSTTYAEEYVKRESVLESEISTLPLTNEANGLSGFYVVPAVGAYRHTYPGSWLFGEKSTALAPPVDDVPDIERASPGSQFLAPWDIADFRRLNFPELVGVGQRRPAAPPSGGATVAPAPQTPPPAAPQAQAPASRTAAAAQPAAPAAPAPTAPQAAAQQPAPPPGAAPAASPSPAAQAPQAQVAPSHVTDRMAGRTLRSSRRP